VSQSDRDKSQSDRDKSQSDRDKSQSDRDKSQSDRDKSQSDRDKSQSDRDKLALRSLPLLVGDRVCLRLATEIDVPEIISFYQNNSKHFDRVSSSKPVCFYTSEFWTEKIKVSQVEFSGDRSCNLFIFDNRANKTTVLGSIDFFAFIRSAFHACILGYGLAESLDRDRALIGEDLIDYVNCKLFPYLQSFKERATSPDTIEYKIGEIFGEIKNRFQSGYSLRDALEYIDELRFRSQQEKHELSHLYGAVF
jgi:hypothetical protein